MALRLVAFLIGFGWSILGGVSCIMYLNLLTAGFSIGEYVQFVSERVECYLLAAGIFMMTVAIYFPTRQ
ncbi:hypothetical protein [Bacillus badius]|uniref:Uncharacterized protein n=1 Tax=Bacillus badius TaxID=1455 RepID=A0ABR5ASK0_BACBA|nr:hypothetical protein [Bacillus badius]KIL73093.1 hypothetical protein SD78_3281 [Bacillus badius]KIL77639.1 hypothetical protein SD77_1312 [Bacillus badius]KZO01211.1 hypothetical protein A4244_13170 [Bacillus badius]KZR59086.1 hypothetical protein A3781_00845 [Bacillus badius]MED0667899.1 hypothetical protein [Bacillus badius]